MALRKKPGDFVDLGTVLMNPVECQKNDNVVVGIYKTSNNIKDFVYSTDGSVCFDIHAYFDISINKVEGYNKLLLPFTRRVVSTPELDYQLGVYIEPGESMMIPTGIHLDIPVGYALDVFPRSGKAFKNHINLINCVGIIDYDYVEELKVLIYNNSNKRQFIGGDDCRLAQGRIIPVPRVTFVKLESKPEQKTNRVGGIGSTDKKVT